jgi:hypothetical protein
MRAAAAPGFPVELVGVDELHAAFLNESRTRGRIQRSVQETPGVSLLHAVTTIRPSITQEPWKFPVKEVCSFQAAIL